MKQFLTLITILSLSIALTGCKKEAELIVEPPEFLSEYPIDVPEDESNPLFFDGLDEAFQVLKELEG